MALIKGKLIDPSTAIKQSSDPVSTEDLARKGYVDGKAEAEAEAAEIAAKAYADQKVADLVNSAPAVLDTLKELSDALGGDENFASTIAGNIGAVDDKVDQEISDRQAAVSAEQSSREAGDQSLQTEIDALELVVSSETTSRQSAMSSEQQARQAADTALSERLDELEADPTTKTYVDGQVSQEASARQAADSGLQSAITSEATRAQGEELRIEGKVDAEETRAEGEESRIEAKVDQEVVNRQSAVSAEQSARELADSELDGRMDVLEADPTTKTYVDGKFSDAESYTDQKVADLVNGAPAMLDTLKELADAISTQGGSLTESILTQVGEVDDKIDQEISDRQAADSVLDGKITTEKNRAEGEEARIEAMVEAETSRAQGQEAAIETRFINNEAASASEVSRAQAAEAGLQSQISQEVQDRQSAVSSEQSRAQGVEASLQSQVSQEVSDRQSAVSSEQSRAQSAEQGLQSQITQEISDRQAAVSAEQSRAQAAESELDSRIDVLEAAPAPKGRKESKTMSASDISNAYVDMAEEAMPNTMLVSVSGTVQYEGEDYVLSTVSSKTRVTFIGDLTPDGNGAALVEGEKVYCQYLVMSTSQQSSGGGSGGSGGGGSGGGDIPPPPSFITNISGNASAMDKELSPYSMYSGWGVVKVEVAMTGTPPQSFLDAGILVYASFNGGGTWHYQETLTIQASQYFGMNLGGQACIAKFVTASGEAQVFVNNF